MLSVNNENKARGETKILDEIYLTKREIECVNWLIKGKSAREIGMILEISEKTVFKHMENLKMKLNCYKQFQLGYIIGKHPSLLSIKNKY